MLKPSLQTRPLLRREFDQPGPGNAGQTHRQITRAVRGDAGNKTREPWMDRAFAAAFSHLVYAQIWEDPMTDLQALALRADDRLITIASGGCNILNYLSASPARIVAVDLNAHHLALTDMKLRAVSHLPNQVTMARFLGQANTPHNRNAFDTWILPTLDAGSRQYWLHSLPGRRARVDRFSSNLFRHGMLGLFIRTAHRIGRFNGVNPAQLLEQPDTDAQAHWFDQTVAPLFQKPAIRWMMAQRPALFGLGIPPAQAELLAAHERSQIVDVILSRLRRLACDFPIRQNYFAQQAFALSYEHCEPDYLPPYLQPRHYANIRDGIGKVSLCHQSMTDLLAQESDASLDAYVLLDAQDWMSDEQLSALWTQIHRTARPGARVIFRTAGQPSILPGRVSASILNQWAYNADESAALHRTDRSAIYGGFHLYRKAGQR